MARRQKKGTGADLAGPVSGVLADLVEGLERHRASDLVANPRNFRTHPQRQRSLLDELLGTVGVAGALLGYRSPTRNPGKITLLDGHARKDAAPDHTWPVLMLRCSDEQADTILAFFDRVSSGAVVDQARLEEHLGSLRIESARLQAEAATWREELGLDRRPDAGAQHVEFTAYDEDLAFDHECPSCGFRWSGKQTK